MGLNPTIFIILCGVNGLKTPVKKVKVPDLINAACENPRRTRRHRYTNGGRTERTEETSTARQEAGGRY